MNNYMYNDFDDDFNNYNENPNYIEQNLDGIDNFNNNNYQIINHDNNCNNYINNINPYEQQYIEKIIKPKSKFKKFNKILNKYNEQSDIINFQNQSCKSCGKIYEHFNLDFNNNSLSKVKEILLIILIAILIIIVLDVFIRRLL